MDLQTSSFGPLSGPESPQKCLRNYIIDVPADVSLECASNLNLLRPRSLGCQQNVSFSPTIRLQTLALAATRRIGQSRLGALARLGPFRFLPGIWRGLVRQPRGFPLF